MDIKYFGAMLLRGIGQAELPISKIERIKEDNSLFYTLAEDNSLFLIRIEQASTRPDELFHKMENTKNSPDNKRIFSIYDSFAECQEYNKILMDSRCDIDWLDEKLSVQEFNKLENSIFSYVLDNDKLIFSLGFKYAWSLFCECMGKK